MTHSRPTNSPSPRTNRRPALWCLILATAVIVCAASSPSARALQSYSAPKSSASSSPQSTSSTNTAVANTASTGAATINAQQQQQQQHLQLIQQRGGQEIDRRLTQLNHLAVLVTAAKHLTTSDKTTLTDQVNNEVSGLQSLKTKLAAETTLAAAQTDARSIITDYRVYALITPKVRLIKLADDQQATEANLTTVASKLQQRIGASSNPTQGQSLLDVARQQIATAQGVSAAVESAVIGLQPTDYNSNHAVLVGYASSLRAAHQDNQTAVRAMQTLIEQLRSAN